MKLVQVPALALAAMLAGCGGGSDSGGVGGAGQLAFAVKWEGPGGAAAGFEDPIPPSVDAIRIIFDSDSAPPCCVAVIRGSQAFEDRHLVLTNTPLGDAEVSVFGFPTTFAPNDGITATCPNSGGGVACSSNDTLPSFGSDDTPVEVLASQTNRVDVDVYSIPFLIKLNIDAGDQVAFGDPIRFTVVDANFPINPDIEVTIDGIDLVIDTSEACEDGSSLLPDCSDEGELEVFGRRIVAHLDQTEPSGPANLRIVAQNTGTPPREMDFSIPVVLQGEPTTTTSTTTSSTSTTSTTETPTTTLPGNDTFCLNFDLATDVDLIGISFTAFYSSTGGDFLGSHENVECVTTLVTEDQENTLASYNDNDQVSLSAAFISAATFSGPTPLAQCVFHQTPPLNLAGFNIQVTEATTPDLESTSAIVTVEEGACRD